MSKPAPTAALTYLARLLARAAAQEWLREQGDSCTGLQALEDQRPIIDMECPVAKNVAQNR